ncbi:putative triacylglycerol lipase [Moniliophthora roreri]|nr:putative triacylglycerol lipase [Moniliophthora roreri]
MAKSTKHVLTEAQKTMYASEKLMNFRWISKVLASYSPRALTSADIAPANLQVELAEIGQFTELAYSTVPITFILENLPSLIQADFPVEGYDALQGSILVSDFHGKAANLHGFTVYRRQTKQLVVSISGTSTVIQSLYDVWTSKHVHPSRKGRVHAGFWALYKGIRPFLLDSIREGLDKHEEVNELVVTGHSMGGAMSYLLMFELLQPNDIVSSEMSLKLVVFGAPRVGDTRLAQHWSQLVQSRKQRGSFHEYSVKAYNDGVPSLPPLALGYRHFTHEPLYFVHGRLYCVPSSESEYALFRVDPKLASNGRPPEHPRGGHNYYNGRDQERFIRRMNWLNDALGRKETNWQGRYRKFLDVWNHISIATNPDEKIQRGTVLAPSPLRVLAESLDLPVHLIPQKKVPEPFSDLSGRPPPLEHVIVTASFGRIIPLKILNLFSQDRRLNVHPSLLPQYRGAAPIQHTILNDDRETGVCIIDMLKRSEGIDAGPIWAINRVAVPDDATFPSLRDRLAVSGGQLLVTVLRDMLSRKATRTIQAELPDAKPAPPISFNDSLLNFTTMTADSIVRRHRAISHQRPLATQISGGHTVQIHDPSVVIRPPKFTPTTPGHACLSKPTKSLLVCCAEGTVLSVPFLKQEGKALLGAQAWWNGAQSLGLVKDKHISLCVDRQ